MMPGRTTRPRKLRTLDDVVRRIDIKADIREAEEIPRGLEVDVEPDVDAIDEPPPGYARSAR